MPVQGFDKPILLIGRENMNRAVQGDVVDIEVFPESEWKAPADEVVDQESEYLPLRHGAWSLIKSQATLKNDDADESEEEGDDVETIAEQKVLRSEHSKRVPAERQPTGRIVGVIKRNWRSCVT